MRLSLLFILIILIIPVQSEAEFTHDTQSEAWNIDMINATSLWDYTTGEGIVVAVIDTGIDFNHQIIII